VGESASVANARLDVQRGDGTGRRRSASFFLWKSAPSVSVVGFEAVEFRLGRFEVSIVSIT
jgi:hypothetical protein